MNRPYKEFRDKFLWCRIDYDNYPEWHWFQCVDLIKLYLDECLWWWKVGALWNANQVPKNLEKKWFCKLDPKKTMIQWDIIVHTQWIYWHIAIVDHILNGRVWVLEQNWTWKNSWSWKNWNEIRLKDYPINRFQTILRNTDIVANYNKEVAYVEEKIEERAMLLKNTTEYRESIQYYKK